MSINISTATNAELREECDKLNKKYISIQKEIAEKLEIMYDLSTKYIEIKSLLNKREGKTNDTAKG